MPVHPHVIKLYTQVCINLDENRNRIDKDSIKHKCFVFLLGTLELPCLMR